MMGEMPKEIPRGVVSLEFFDDEVSVGFFHKRKEREDKPQIYFNFLFLN